MAAATVEAPAGFKAINDHDGGNEITGADVTNKRSSEDAEHEGPSTASKKRKAAPKATAKGGNKKGTAKKVGKANDNAVQQEASDEEAATVTPPSTPAPKKAAKNAKTPEPKKRATPKSETASPRGIPIPKSWEEAGPADRMLVKMKDEKKDWAEIRKVWKDLTGEDTGKSSLPNRYLRIKCNMTRLGAGHDRVLLEVELAVEAAHKVKKAKLEAELEASRWASIVDGVKERTGVAYQTPFLQKNSKELKAKGGLGALPEAAENENDEQKAGEEAEEGGDKEDNSSVLSDVKSEEEAAE